MNMKRVIIRCLLILVGGTLVTWAAKSTPFSDVNTYLKRGRDIVIAKCISSPAREERNRHKSGIYAAQVEIIEVNSSKLFALINPNLLL
jgi:hypothetical protein